MTGDVLLAIARASLRRATRREIPAAFDFASRLMDLGPPFPATFEPIDEWETGEVYFSRLRPQGHVVPSLEGLSMSDAEATALYREGFRRG